MDTEEPRFFDEKELRVELLNPKLKWINAVFTKSSQVVGTSKIANEIMIVFGELYNLYALSQNFPLTGQPKPYRNPPKIDVFESEKESKHVENDQGIIDRTTKLLSKIGNGEMPKKADLPGLQDFYRIYRKTLPLSATKKTFVNVDGRERSLYLDSKFSSEDFQSRIDLFDEFQAQINKIAQAMNVKQGFIQIVLTNPLTDAKRLGKECVLANLMRFEKNKSIFFWLFAISREVAYMKEGRLSYRHMCILRDILMTTLGNLSSTFNKYS